MNEQNNLRKLIQFRFAPLLDVALSLLVLQNPERFGTAAPWIGRVTERLPAGLLEQLRSRWETEDLFSVALSLEDGPPMPTPDKLRRLAETDAELGALLLAYWEAVSPEVGAKAGLLAEAIQRELSRLADREPQSFITSFSDRVSVESDAILLHWGAGIRVPLAELERIIFVPSAFSPRRLMFYRLDSVQIFFYDPLHQEPAETDEPPESLVLGFSALADATRLRILRLIAREPVPAQEMARRLGLNESTVSRHLRVLVEAGLVGRERQEGKYIIYSLQAERFDLITAAVKRYLGRERV